ncbi:MAG: hypothetical protein H6570_09385 [Lewinellaceae bacterium]|nr:hypothetical protein [Lewinellaceae bacterium]
MQKFNVAILRTEFDEDYRWWEKVCRLRQNKLNYTIVDLSRSDWFEQIAEGNFDGLLAIPPGLTSALKTMYDERLAIISRSFDIPIYPSVDEVLVYENKKYLAYWLKANKIPHPATHVFYHDKDAYEFLSYTGYPVVGKMSVGASGKGVVILRNEVAARRYVANLFAGKGGGRVTGPNWRKKGLITRAFKKLFKPSSIMDRLRHYRLERSELQRDFVIFQEFIPHQFEWRCVRIGESFFAHKKMVKGEKASGALLKNYDNPPLELLDFIKEITDRAGFYSLSVDLFVDPDGHFLVNEMQCIFGQSDPYQMLVDGEPGRYRYLDGHWVFEAGDFNQYLSFLLRIDHFIQILSLKHHESLLI